jgi:glycosyltransferase involved in cell wall biosynthesis
MKVSVIMSTYNSVDWLEKVLWSFNAQSFTDFEIIIADDGSTEETKQKIEELNHLFLNPIIHVWHEDNGFQKTKILNKAIMKSNSEYLIFTDGDCIPRFDFVETHMKYREKGFFLSGGYFKLPMNISKMITKQDIISQNCFNLNWLKTNGFNATIKSLKLTSTKIIGSLLNKITPTKPTWNGHNSSGWKQDLIGVNGFNEEMQYGGEDRELGERLFNFGLSSKQIRYSAICVHLDHSRGYVTDEVWQKNNAIRNFTKANKVTKTSSGIFSN